MLIHDTWLEKSPSNSQPSRSLPLFGTPKALTVPRDFYHDWLDSGEDFLRAKTNGSYEERCLNRPPAPAVRDHLGLKELDVTDWRFVLFRQVPWRPSSILGENNKRR